jgi:fusaric acid resistance family protein
MLKPNRNLLANLRSGWLDWPIAVHSLRTAVGTVVSVAAARLARLSEAYWAPVTTLVITQSSLGAALAVSRQRFAGTAVGAAVSALVATYFGPRVLVFGACLEDRLPSFCRGLHRNRRRAALGDSVAGRGGRYLNQAMKFL